MNKIRFTIGKRICLVGLMAWMTTASFAQHTLTEMQSLTINQEVTTHITSGEKIKYVDISTDKVAGDQPLDNVIRLKPKEALEDGQTVGIITIVTERYRVQYGLVYTSQMSEAVSDKQINFGETTSFKNPRVEMSFEEMALFARKVWNSSAHYRDVSNKAHRMEMRLNNIYSVGDYFFLDFSVQNRTNIRFDIDEIHLYLNDKKITKATNTQSVELQPEMMLQHVKTFKKGYRNVIVVKKLTFPDEKVLTIELSENQISGRNIKLNIDYEDVLGADSFHEDLLNQR